MYCKQKWTYENVVQGVKEVMNAYGIDRMPSKSECDKFYGDYCLSNVITKRYGWYKLAKELGLSIKDSETSFGKSQEGVVCEMLIGKGFEPTRMPQNFPYDILVDNCVKVDVKASHLHRGKQGNFYAFNLEKKFATCDVYVLLTLDDENNILNTFVVPSVFVIKNTQISIGEVSSRYDKFKDRWDYIFDLSQHFSGLVIHQNDARN